MKFSVASSELLKALTRASGVVPSRSTLPILENYLFELTRDQLKITATDLEISITTSLVVKGEDNGKVAIPAKRIMETIRALPVTDLAFNVDSTSKKVTMTTKNGEYRLGSEGSEDYPAVNLPKSDGEMAIEK